MLKYICKHCDDLESETSVCPVCGNRTTLVSKEIYYCPECNVPSFNDTCPVCQSKCKKIGSDIRPVFAQERLLLEVLLNKPMEFAGKSIWSTTSNTYYVDGKKVTLSITEARKKDPERVIEVLKQYDDANKSYEEADTTNQFVKKFVEVNHYRLNSITEEAVQYIQSIAQGFELSSIFSSFSGGKDSTVTSNLAMKALLKKKMKKLKISELNIQNL